MTSSSPTQTQSWTLECSHCDTTLDPAGLPTVCPDCGDPWLVRYGTIPDPSLKHAMGSRDWDMWRYREWMPLAGDEKPVTLGEGLTPLLRAPALEKAFGLGAVYIKDESQNPCGSFTARGLSAAVTRAVLNGATSFVLPTAGNAGVALAAYGRRAGVPVRVYAPRTTPPTILAQIRIFGADLELLDGHIGDCGVASRAFAAETGAVEFSTLREPYRIEGKKTLGLEIAEQLGWTLPDCILYPTGGGTGLIGMWKAFNELRAAGWLTDASPRLFSVQASGCAPVVKAFEANVNATDPWPDPQTVASGLRVPAPLGGKVILRAIRETNGGAVAVTDEALTRGEKQLCDLVGIDACPEGGATYVALEDLMSAGQVVAGESVVLFNTGAGWLYR